VRHATLVTPNAAESRHFGGGDEVTEAGRWLCRQWQARAVVVTQGERGATLVRAGSEEPVPVPLVRAADAGDRAPDTCGAGDQFAASAAVALLSGADTEAAVRAAVKEAAAYVGAGAAASVSVRAAARADVTLAAATGTGGRPVVQSSEVS
jgi:sugar/nucleoside kinase (ribokinase family)